MSCEFSPDQLEALFHATLKAGDARGVEASLRALVCVDPRRAVRLHDDLQAALRVWSASL